MTDRGQPARIGLPLTGAKGDVLSLAYRPDGRQLAAGVDQHDAVAWTPATSSTGRPVAGAGSIGSLAFGPSGRLLFAAGRGAPSGIWDMTAPGGPRRLPRPTVTDLDRVNLVASSRDGRRVAVNNNEIITLWDLAADGTARETGTLPFPVLGYSLALSDDGSLLVVGSGDPAAQEGGQVTFWDVRDPGGRYTQIPDRLFDTAMLGNEVDVAPDRRTVAIGSGNNAFSLWAATDHRRIGEPHNGTGSRVVEYGLGGRLLVTGGEDDQLTVWDIQDPADPQQLGLPLAAPSGWVAALGPGGRTMATDNRLDDSVQQWDLQTMIDRRDAVVPPSCTAAGGDLTATEWHNRVPALDQHYACPRPASPSAPVAAPSSAPAVKVAGSGLLMPGPWAASVSFGPLSAVQQDVRSYGPSRDVDPAMADRCAETVVINTIGPDTGAIHGVGLTGDWTAAEDPPGPQVRTGARALRQQIVSPPPGSAPGTTWSVGARLIADGIDATSTTTVRLALVKREGRLTTWEVGTARAVTTCIN